MLRSLASAPIVALQETHGDDAKAKAFEELLPPQVEIFWSHHTHRKGGLAMLVDTRFVARKCPAASSSTMDTPKR